MPNSVPLLPPQNATLAGTGLDIVLNPSGILGSGVVTSWSELMGVIASLQPDQFARVTVAESYAIPSPGMPPAGYDMKNAEFYAASMATGTITLTMSPGVILDNLRSIQNGLVLTCSPNNPGESPCLTFSAPPAGGPAVFVIANGAAFQNLGSLPAMTTPGVPGSQAYLVLACNSAAVGAIPPSSAPWVEVMGDDVLIANQTSAGLYGGFPDDWATTASANATLAVQDEIDSHAYALSAWAGQIITLTGVALPPCSSMPPVALPLPVRPQAPFITPQAIPHGCAVEIDKFGIGQWGQGGEYFGVNGGPDAPAPGTTCQVRWDGPCEVAILPGEIVMRGKRIYSDPLLSPYFTTVDPGNNAPVRGVIFDKYTYATNGISRALLYWFIPTSP